MKKLGYALVALLGVGLDQLVKWWVRSNMVLRVDEIPVLRGVLSLFYIDNTGGAWGILGGVPWLFLIIIPLVVLGIAFYLFIRKPTPGWLPGIPLALLLAGAVGNFIDRVALGFVVDMFRVDFINFPVFNVADIFVVCSVIVLAGWMLWAERQEKKAADQGDNAVEAADDAKP